MTSGLLSSVTFGAFLAYSPRGSSNVSIESRSVCYGVKNGNEALLRRIVDKMVAGPIPFGFLGPEVALVPCPRSAPLVANALWPAALIARALVERGLGKEVRAVLTRTLAVPKSSFQARGQRASASTHFDTLAAERTLLPSPTLMVVVDDVVTKGSMLLAAVSRVKEAYPLAEVAAFALVRTLGLQPEIESIVDPCLGTIRLVGDEGDRVP
jgi:hypothetical protein